LPVFKINLDLPPKERFVEPTLKMRGDIIKTVEFFD
jgi:hypothetical protein